MIFVQQPNKTFRANKEVDIGQAVFQNFVGYIYLKNPEILYERSYKKDRTNCSKNQRDRERKNKRKKERQKERKKNK